MTLSVTIGGTDVTDRIRLEDGYQTITANADGTFASCGLKVDDPDSSLIIGRFQEVVIEEDDCSDPRLFTGYVIEARPSRGTFRSGVERVWNIDVGDLNVLLHLQAFHLADAKRPQETLTARRDWLLGTDPASYFVNNSFFPTFSGTFDEADYRGQYVDSVLGDFAAIGRIFFLYWDDPDVAIYCAGADDGFATSTLSISNVLADVDGSSVFAPAPDAELVIDMSQVYDEVILNWTGGTTFLTDYDGRMPSPLHRTGVFETPRVGRAATALAEAQILLDRSAGDAESITCTILLPSDKVNLIQAGMLVPVKFTHLPDYTTYTNLRVAQRSVNIAPVREVDALVYAVTLTLTLRGILTPGGGGGTGGFPHEPPGNTAPDMTIDWCNTAVEDNGRQADADGTELAVDGDDWYFEISQTQHDASGKINELSLFSTGIVTNPIFNFATLYTDVEFGTGTAINPLGSPPLPLRSGTFTVGPNTGGGPTVFHVRFLADYWGANPIIDECFHLDMWRGTSRPSGDTPPSPGQWIYGETVAGTGFARTTAWPYAAGSLIVRVDGVPISRASYTETDNTTGAFALSWTPDADEVVSVDYQGI